MKSPPLGLGIHPHIVEAVLNHVSGHKRGVAGIYNKALYFAEKRQALDLWAEFVLSLVGQLKAMPSTLKDQTEEALLQPRFAVAQRPSRSTRKAYTPPLLLFRLCLL